MLPIPLLLSACLALGPSAAVADATRAWDFDLRAPGLYKVQIEHPIDALSGARVAYEISIGDETTLKLFGEAAWFNNFEGSADDAVALTGPTVNRR